MTDQRLLRILIISMGGERQAILERLFSDIPNVEIRFVPGIPSRDLRGRKSFLKVANDVGLLPKAEWEALRECNVAGMTFFDCLEHIPVPTEGRQGSVYDRKLHYAVELWRKAKTLNRSRAELACCFAHLNAMRIQVEEDYHVILEDNVRFPHSVVESVWEIIQASNASCHLRYYGWLGPEKNVTWMYESYFPRFEDSTTVQAPTTQDIADDLQTTKGEIESKDNLQQPGGTAFWGAYAYWVSREAYNAIMSKLRCDVGAMLWKGKRNRCYSVKPIDKILPRLVRSMGRVEIPKKPVFFRAPMLTSKIHTQWDPAFCKSTSVQLQATNVSWNDLLLTDMEHRIVQHAQESGSWLTPIEMSQHDKEHERGT